MSEIRIKKKYFYETAIKYFGLVAFLVSQSGDGKQRFFKDDLIELKRQILEA